MVMGGDKRPRGRQTRAVALKRNLMPLEPRATVLLVTPLAERPPRPAMRSPRPQRAEIEPRLGYKRFIGVWEPRRRTWRNSPVTDFVTNYYVSHEVIGNTDGAPSTPRAQHYVVNVGLTRIADIRNDRRNPSSASVLKSR